jgi:hypothetical protein
VAAASKPGRGFARADVLAVLAGVAVLAGLWLPALGQGASGSAAVGCLNNLRQLAQAFVMFTEDRQGFVPANVDDGGLYNWSAGNAGVGGQHEFNPDVLTASSSVLAGYLGRRSEPFKCPADARVGRYQGTNDLWRGQLVPAARSYSLNLAVGTKQDGTTAVDGGWLDGTHSNYHNRPWRTYGRLADMIEPTPAGLFVFLDEAPISLNDGNFGMSMRAGEQAEWIDWPATYHDFGAGFAFGDGHAELRAWEDPRTRIPDPPRFRVPVPGSPDVAWMQVRTSALAR